MAALALWESGSFQRTQVRHQKMELLKPMSGFWKPWLMKKRWVVASLTLPYQIYHPWNQSHSLANARHFSIRSLLDSPILGTTGLVHEGHSIYIWQRHRSHTYIMHGCQLPPHCNVGILRATLCRNLQLSTAVCEHLTNTNSLTSISPSKAGSVSMITILQKIPPSTLKKPSCGFNKVSAWGSEGLYISLPFSFQLLVHVQPMSGIVHCYGCFVAYTKWVSGVCLVFRGWMDATQRKYIHLCPWYKLSPCCWLAETQGYIQ